MFPSVSASGTIRSSRAGETFCPATQWIIRTQTARLRMVNTMLVAKRRSARRYTKAVGTAVSSQEVDSVKMNTMVVGIAWRKDRAKG